MDIPTEKFISALLFNPQLWIQETVENHDHPCPFRTWHVKRESSTALAIHICKLFYTHSYIHVVPFIKKWQTFPPSIPPSLFNFFFFMSVWSKMTTIRGWWHSKWWKRPICNLLQGQKVSPRFPHKLIARLWQICCRSNLVKTGKKKQIKKPQKLQIIFLHYSDEWLHLWFYHYVSDGMFFMLFCWCKHCNKNNKDEDANLYNVWITEITSSWNSK